MQETNKKLEVCLIDTAFSHLWRDDGCHSVTHGKIQNNIKYTRNSDNKIKLITNESILNYKRKDGDRLIYWLIEPRCVCPDLYRLVEKNELDYDLLLSHDLRSFNKNKKFSYTPLGGCWIKDTKNLTKNKMLSMILSQKQFSPGHVFRHACFNFLRSNFSGIDYYGSGSSKRIENKEEGLSGYRFSIVVENSNDYGWFTEKLIDCFRCKTIPIYWGSDTSEYFDERGILRFENIFELANIVKNLNVQKYEQLLDFAEINYKNSFKYETTEQNFDIKLFGENS